MLFLFFVGLLAILRIEKRVNKLLYFVSLLRYSCSLFSFQDVHFQKNKSNSTKYEHGNPKNNPTLLVKD